MNPLLLAVMYIIPADPFFDISQHILVNSYTLIIIDSFILYLFFIFSSH